jgi:nucleoside diphosphate kinase
MAGKKEIAYLLITPYALLKSRTGGIIGRALSQAELSFAGIRMLAPDDRFVDEYIATVHKYNMPAPHKQALTRYIDHNLRPQNRLGRANRAMLLLFEGVDAVEILRKVAGPLELWIRGDNIRGTFGDFIAYPSGEVIYLEPAVLFPEDTARNDEHLSQLASLMERTSCVLEGVIKYPEGMTPETTLVMLKPDLFTSPSARPGNIIDMFSRTGLYIVGARIIHMSVAQAVEFYGFLEKVFEKKLVRNVAIKLASLVENEQDKAFDFPIVPDEYQKMARIIADKNAHAEFAKIVEYMTGLNPDDLPDKYDPKSPGKQMCVALLYQGENAIQKIRDKLGSTDPSKAGGGTVRRDYGADLMRNGAHASDSVKSAERERAIIGLVGNEPSAEAALIREYLKK